MTFYIILSLISLPLSLLLHLALGRVFARSLFKESSESFSNSLLYLFGILLHLTGVLFLVCLSFPLWLATLCPFIPALYPLTGGRERFAIPRVHFTMNYAVWLSIHLAIGLSLFQETDGIVTAWRNNYGDLAFHLGMISSFVFGGTGVPEFHLYPGTILSYPFFINFWSALYFNIAPTWYVLSVVFLFQWCVIWTLIYRFLDGDKNILLPWAVLLGGGSYFALGTEANSVSSEKAPFSVFITTIWVTQRSAMFGVAVSLAILKLVFDWLERRAAHLLLLAAYLMMLSPLVHAHFLLTVAVYLLILLVVLVCTGKVRMSELYSLAVNYWKQNVVFIFTAVLLSLWLLQKKSLVKIIYGWYGRGDGALAQIFSSTGMWLQALFPIFIAFFLLWVSFKRHAFYIPLIITFVLANFVQISIWEWDQLKIFLGIYVIFLFLWSRQEDDSLRYLQVVLLFFMAPALYDLGKIFLKGENITVFTKRDLEYAEALRTATPIGSRIAAFGKHNSPVVLSGRPIFSGYDGTLFSHGIEYHKRKEMNDDFSKLMQCKPDEEVCPDYLFFTDDEKRQWKRSSLKGSSLVPTGLPYLYKLRYR